MTKIRVHTDYEGVVEETCANLPDGDGKTCGPSPAEDLFAELQQDSESGLDHALYRQYSSTFGSLTTPDPYSGSYDVFNPQSMNRYAYVGGSPFGGVDPSGLDDCSWDPDGILGCRLSNHQAALALGVSAVSSDIPLLSTILSSPAAVLGGSAAVFADVFYDFGESFGWWGGGSSFHGNVSASQSGKNVPAAQSAATYTPLPDPDDERIRQLAIGINNGAGWVGSPQGIAEFYGASAVGAIGVLALPAAGGALNEALFGEAEGRLVWSGFQEGAMDAAEESGLGRTIGQSPIGKALSATLGNGGPGQSLANAAWQAASKYWAAGATGPITAFIFRQGYVWTNIELPELFANPGVNPSNLITWPNSITMVP